MPWLIHETDAGETAAVELNEENPKVVIGRHRSCPIRSRDGTVSRRHAEVIYEAGRVIVCDLKSRNGTYYGRKRVDSAEVAPGESFLCGKFRVHVSTSPPGEPGTVDPAPPPSPPPPVPQKRVHPTSPADLAFEAAASAAADEAAAAAVAAEAPPESEPPPEGELEPEVLASPEPLSAA